MESGAQQAVSHGGRVPGGLLQSAPCTPDPDPQTHACESGPLSQEPGQGGQWAPTRTNRFLMEILHRSVQPRLGSAGRCPPPPPHPGPVPPWSLGAWGAQGSQRPPRAAPGVQVGHEPQRGASLQDARLGLPAASWVLADVVEDEGRGLVQGAEVQRVAVGGRDVHDHGQRVGLQAPLLRVHDLGRESALSACPAARSSRA